jgi:hypothetical protein
MAPVVRAKYQCTQDELYAIANLAINNLNSDLTAFAAKKAKYDAAYVTGRRALRTTAMNLPDEESRNGVHQVLKNLLPGLVNPIKDNFMDLKGYIRDAWPGENPVPRYEAAGLIKYNNIREENWEEVVALNQKMIAFVTDFAGPLATPGGMVVGFPTKLTGDRDAFDAVYDPFMSSKETGTATAAKVTANNTLYTGIMEFMKDGVEMIFRNDEDNKKRYVFAKLKDLVSPPGSASLNITLKAQGTNAPMNNITVTIQKDGGLLLTATSNAEGELSFLSIDPAPYVVKVMGPLGVLILEKDVNTGVGARLEITVPV